MAPLGVWALAFGSSLGWGAFVMSGTSFLPTAGPLGTILGFLFGIFTMLIICTNYNYMMNKFPDAGGTFTYTKESYFIISLWCILGLIFFRYVFAKNPQKHLNIANVVWISLLILILFTSEIWVNKTSKAVSKDIAANISEYYKIQTKDRDDTKINLSGTDSYLNKEISKLDNTISFYGIIQLSIVVFVLILKQTLIWLWKK